MTSSRDERHDELIAEALGSREYADPGPARLEFERRRFLALVSPRSDGDRFELATPHAVIEVHGTLFSVAVDEIETVVGLHEGEIRLLCGDRAVAVEAGHRVVAREEGLVSMGMLDPRARARDLELARIDATGERAGAAGGGDVAGTAAEPAPVPAETPAAVREDTAESAASTAAGGIRARGSDKGRAERPEAGLLERVSEAFALRRYEEVLALSEAAGSDPEVLYYRARALSKLDRWREAGETYTSVVHGRGGSRTEAIYLAADAFRRARLFDRGLEMADLAIGMGGPNADHAWSVKIASLTGLGQIAKAASAAESYLRAFPSGAHVGEARFAIASGHRSARRWSEAARAYREVLEVEAGGGDAMRDSASFFLGYCLVMAGEEGRGRGLLERYAKDFPNGRHADQVERILAR